MEVHTTLGLGKQWDILQLASGRDDGFKTVFRN